MPMGKMTLIKANTKLEMTQKMKITRLERNQKLLHKQVRELEKDLIADHHKQHQLFQLICDRFDKMADVFEFKKSFRTTMENDIHFKEFFNDCVLVDDTCTTPTRISDIFQEYKDWYRENNGNGRSKKQKELIAFMDKEYGDYYREQTAYTKRGYLGLMLKSKIEFLESVAGTVDELDAAYD